MSKIQENVDATYGSSRLAERLMHDLQSRGFDPDSLTTDDLLPYDELHLMGRHATRALGQKADALHLPFEAERFDGVFMIHLRLLRAMAVK